MSTKDRRPWYRSPAVYWLVFVLAAAGTVGGLLLLENIRTRKQEGEKTFLALADLSETSVDPMDWAKNFPREHDGYMRTVDIERTRHGGSEAFQKLDADPVWRTIFNGYAFAIDYREERGHAYMLQDQRTTERVTTKPQPGACLQCHASNAMAYRKVGIEAGAPGTLEDPLLSETGQAQLFAGFERVCPMPYDEATALVSHPISCIDCHDPETARLRVTRPAFLVGIRALAESKAPTPQLPSIERWRASPRGRPYDPNVDATRQEMRALACAQCHVEYHFAGDKKLVTYPWANGLKVEEIEAYYDSTGWSDWTHADSGAKVLKAQHPEFEMWSQGIHARSGVACADCHMPYKREGALKVSDHHVRSPALNIARACQTCHNYSEAELLARIETIQDRTASLMDRAEAAVLELIVGLQTAAGSGASDQDLAPARALQRKAQWRLDFVSAENSMGFHADQEAARILAEAIDYARQGTTAVAALGARPGTLGHLPDPASSKGP